LHSYLLAWAGIACGPGALLCLRYACANSHMRKLCLVLQVISMVKAIYFTDWGWALSMHTLCSATLSCSAANLCAQVQLLSEECNKSLPVQFMPHFSWLDDHTAM
jgi:hypothetical protein